MAQQTIDIGAAPNDGTGDTLRDAFGKANDNFTELYGLGGGGGSVSLTLALSDLTSDLVAGTSQGFWDPPFPITIQSVSAAVFEAPTGSGIQVDINEEGVTVLSTKITIDATELRSVDSATPPVVSDTAITGRLTFDIDAVGSTLPGKGLQVTVEYVAA